MALWLLPRKTLRIFLTNRSVFWAACWQKHLANPARKSLSLICFLSCFFKTDSFWVFCVYRSQWRDAHWLCAWSGIPLGNPREFAHHTAGSNLERGLLKIFLRHPYRAISGNDKTPEGCNLREKKRHPRVTSEGMPCENVTPWGRQEVPCFMLSSSVPNRSKGMWLFPQPGVFVRGNHN